MINPAEKAIDKMGEIHDHWMLDGPEEGRRSRVLSMIVALTVLGMFFVACLLLPFALLPFGHDDDNHGDPSQGAL